MSQKKSVLFLVVLNDFKLMFAIQKVFVPEPRHEGGKGVSTIMLRNLVSHIATFGSHFVGSFYIQFGHVFVSTDAINTYIMP